MQMSGSFAELFEFLNADRILGVLGIVVGFGGALLAWIFYQVGVATKSMSYDHSVATLLSPGGGSLPAEVAVFFGNEQIRNLRSASVRFWNSGSTTINGDDLVSRSGLSIKLREEISDHQQHD